MDNQQETAFELGWLAGIVDGEGWLGMSVSHQYRGPDTDRMPFFVKVELKITNCDEAIIEKSDRILRTLDVNPYRRTQRLGATRRPVHECAIKSMTSMEKVLPPLLPHLTGIKRQRADIILEFCTRRRANLGIERPGFDLRSGQRGPRTIRPYTDEELSLIDACRELQMRGASETTRETRTRTLKALQRDHVQMRSQWAPQSEMI